MRRGVAASGLRGAGRAPVRVVEETTGRLVGTVDEPSAHLLVHAGAVYVHQGENYLVSRLDLADQVAFVEQRRPRLHHDGQVRDRGRDPGRVCRP